MIFALVAFMPMQESLRAFEHGHYLQAARYAFSAAQDNERQQSEGYARVTESLVREGMPYMATYFFIRTLQSGNRQSTQKVLRELPALLRGVGSEFLKPFLLKYTQYEDYNDRASLAAWMFIAGKSAMLHEDYEKAIMHFGNAIHAPDLEAESLFLRGTAQVLVGRLHEGVRDFEACRDRAQGAASAALSRDTKTPGDSHGSARFAQQGQELKERCQAALGRALYELESFDQAANVFQMIDKKSIVWPEILFEEAWTAYRRSMFGQSLGKLMSYRSPLLAFIYNPEIGVLRAQAHLALCHYQDAMQEIKLFEQQMTPLGSSIRHALESHEHDLPFFASLGKQALMMNRDPFMQMLGSVVRSPYYQRLSVGESRIQHELQHARTLGTHGFVGFLQEVGHFFTESLHAFEGILVKNTLVDYNAELIENFDKMSFMKVEVLKVASDSLQNIKPAVGVNMRTPSIPTSMLYWTFNGEFWSDELGDYVVATTSACAH